MSKCYVIKNKEGKYWRSKFDKKGNILLTDDIVDAMPYEEDEVKMLECPKDCTIVPITICEGDLEEENQVLKKALLEIRDSCIYAGEVCVDESKWHISSENAVDKIRSYLREMDFAFDDIEDKLGIDYFIKARKQQAKESEKDD